MKNIHLNRQSSIDPSIHHHSSQSFFFVIKEATHVTHTRIVFQGFAVKCTIMAFKVTYDSLFLVMSIIILSQTFLSSALMTPHTLFVDRRVLSAPPSSSSFSCQAKKSVQDDQIYSEEESSASPDTTYFSPNRPLRSGEDNGDDDNKESFSTIESSANEYSFFDEATVYVRAGSGGQGSSTYKKGVGGQDGPPDGGNAGKGGNVIMIVDDSLNTLAGLTNAWRPNSFGGSGAASSSSFREQRKSFRAENGSDGGRQMKSGRYGKDVTIRVPPGTVVYELTEHEDGSEDLMELGSLVLDDPDLIVALGGEGGEGSGINKGRGIRRPRIPPEGGERKTLRLTLKIVADVALVAVPNAGKSTLLSAVTRAKPKIANYPFTTLIPNLGVWVPPESKYGNDGETTDGAGSDGLVLCDVPGLISGAAKGVGLGHAFLRHVERCHVILHIIDATSNDPVADFHMLNKELVNYGTGQLGRMPQVVVVNKLDALEGRGEDWEAGLKAKYSREELQQKLVEEMSHTRLMWMSAKEREGVDDLMGRMAMFVKKVKATDTE
jgi:GTP-binding protein